MEYRTNLPQVPLDDFVQTVEGGLKRAVGGCGYAYTHAHTHTHTHTHTCKHANTQVKSTTLDLLGIGQDSECNARFKVPAEERLASPVESGKDNATPSHTTHELTCDILHLVVVSRQCDHDDQIAQPAWRRVVTMLLAENVLMFLCEMF
jgi:hypothetical protein